MRQAAKCFGGGIVGFSPFARCFAYGTAARWKGPARTSARLRSLCTRRSPCTRRRAQRPALRAACLAPRCASLLPRAAAARAFRVAAAAERTEAASVAPVVRSDAALHHRRRLISRAATAAADATAADALRLYNTLSRQKEVFTPRADQVRAFVETQAPPKVACCSALTLRLKTGEQGVDVRLRRDGVRLQVLSRAPARAPDTLSASLAGA